MALLSFELRVCTRSPLRGCGAQQRSGGAEKSCRKGTGLTRFPAKPLRSRALAVLTPCPLRLGRTAGGVSVSSRVRAPIGNALCGHPSEYAPWAVRGLLGVSDSPWSPRVRVTRYRVHPWKGLCGAGPAARLLCICPPAFSAPRGTQSGQTAGQGAVSSTLPHPCCCSVSAFLSDGCSLF